MLYVYGNHSCMSLSGRVRVRGPEAAPTDRARPLAHLQSITTLF